jgi:hypothetical protein
MSGRCYDVLNFRSAIACGGDPKRPGSRAAAGRGVERRAVNGGNGRSNRTGVDSARPARHEQGSGHELALLLAAVRTKREETAEACN